MKVDDHAHFCSSCETSLPKEAIAQPQVPQEEFEAKPIKRVDDEKKNFRFPILIGIVVIAAIIIAAYIGISAFSPKPGNYAWFQEQVPQNQAEAQYQQTMETAHGVLYGSQDSNSGDASGYPTLQQGANAAGFSNGN
jgi:hypothetical protein